MFISRKQSYSSLSLSTSVPSFFAFFMIAPFESSFLMSTTSAATRIICLHFVRYLSFSSSSAFTLTFFAFKADSGSSDALLSVTSGSLSRLLTLCGASSACFEDLRHFLLRESRLSCSLSSEYEESWGEPWLRDLPREGLRLREWLKWRFLEVVSAAWDELEELLEPDMLSWGAGLRGFEVKTCWGFRPCDTSLCECVFSATTQILPSCDCNPWRAQSAFQVSARTFRAMLKFCQIRGTEMHTSIRHMIQALRSVSSAHCPWLLSTNSCPALSNMSSPFKCVKDCGRNFPTGVGLSVHKKKCKVSRAIAVANAAKLLEMKKRAKEEENWCGKELELEELARSEKQQKFVHPLASEIWHDEGHHAALAFGTRELEEARALRDTVKLRGDLERVATSGLSRQPDSLRPASQSRKLLLRRPVLLMFARVEILNQRWVDGKRTTWTPGGVIGK